MTSAKCLYFWTPCSHLATDLYYKIHATLLCLLYGYPPPPTHCGRHKSEVPLPGMVGKDVLDQAVAAVLQDVDDGVVEGILVLLQPPGDVVADRGRVVDDGKVGLLVKFGGGLGEVGRFAEMVALQLFLKGLVGGLREKGLFLQNRQDAHRLFKHRDAGLEVHPKVDHLPVDTLPEVLFLLQHKHVMVEELLELFIAEVDAELLETIELQVVGVKKSGVFAHTNLVYYQVCIAFFQTQTLKISNPAISRTPMKETFFIVGSTRVSLHFSTRKLNTRL